MNLGFNIEKDLVFNLNKKKYYELTPFLKDIFNVLVGIVFV